VPPPSKIDLLDDAIRQELDEKIVSNGFGGYVALSAWLEDKGYSIGKSAVGAYGMKLERRLAAVKASTEAARQIASAAPDDADDRSNAVMAMVQTGIFDAMLALDEVAEGGEAMPPEKRVALLSKVAKNIATLSRASVNRNKWAMEVREKVLLDAAQRVEAAAHARGLSAEDARFWREQVLMGV